MKENYKIISKIDIARNGKIFYLKSIQFNHRIGKIQAALLTKLEVLKQKLIY